MEKPERDASVIAMRCTCQGNDQRMDLDKVTVIIDCGTCKQIALGISNSSIEDIIRTLEYIRDNMPENQRYRPAS